MEILDELGALTAAPLHYVRGATTYEVSPLTATDIGALQVFAQMFDYYRLSGLGDVHISDELKKTTLDKCISQPVSFTSPYMLTVLSKSEGMVEAVYHSLKHKHASISREDLKQWAIYDIENITALVLIVSGVIGKEPPAPPVEGSSEDQKKRYHQNLQARANSIALVKSLKAKALIG